MIMKTYSDLTTVDSLSIHISVYRTVESNITRDEKIPINSIHLDTSLVDRKSTKIISITDLKEQIFITTGVHFHNITFMNVREYLMVHNH